MENDLMINSKTVKVLRKNLGWSQEQLAKASGLSLRTIQRVESEGKASLETKVCLAATLKTNLEKLDAPSASPTLKTFEYNKVVIMLLLATILLSVTGLLIDNNNPVFLLANIVSIIGTIHISLSWYFAPSSVEKDSIRSQAQAGFIYVALFSFFAIAGGFGPTVIPSMIFSLAVFIGIFYMVKWIQKIANEQ